MAGSIDTCPFSQHNLWGNGYTGNREDCRFLCNMRIPVLYCGDILSLQCSQADAEEDGEACEGVCKE